MEEQHIIDYILENTNHNCEYRLKQRLKHNWKKEFNLFYCKHCKKAYEYGRTTCSRGRKVIIRYDDFPILGLERKVCMNCNIEIALEGSKHSVNKEKKRK